eukprot:75926-Rhodomonas_salina.2
MSRSSSSHRPIGTPLPAARSRTARCAHVESLSRGDAEAGGGRHDTKARHDTTRQEARQDTARQDKTRQDTTKKRHDRTRNKEAKNAQLDARVGGGGLTSKSWLRATRPSTTSTPRHTPSSSG